MSTTIAFGTAPTVLPVSLLTYASARPSKNIIHVIPGQTSPGVTFDTAGTRSGTMTLVFTTESDSLTIEQAMEQGTIFTLADATLTSMGMRFVTQGEIVRTLDPETQNAWTLAFGFQEVL